MTLKPFLRVTGARTGDGHPVVLMFGRNLPGILDAPQAVAAVPELLAGLPVDGQFAIVYCHAYAADTSFFGVRAFRRAYETIPREIRERVARVYALHVSFATRAHIYANSSWMECGDYAKLSYCDLIVDLERDTGIDVLLTGLEDADVMYDGIMRTWLVRDDEIRPTKAPDPSQPQFDWNAIDFSRTPDVTPKRPVFNIADGV